MKLQIIEVNNEWIVIDKSRVAKNGELTLSIFNKPIVCDLDKAIIYADGCHPIIASETLYTRYEIDRKRIGMLLNEYSYHLFNSSDYINAKIYNSKGDVICTFLRDDYESWVKMRELVIDTCDKLNQKKFNSEELRLPIRLAFSQGISRRQDYCDKEIEDNIIQSLYNPIYEVEVEMEEISKTFNCANWDICSLKDCNCLIKQPKETNGFINIIKITKIQ